MAANVNVEVLRSYPPYVEGEWQLHLQLCRYHEHEGGLRDHKDGYRFIWTRPDNSLQAARGQARIESLQYVFELIQHSYKEGWGHYEAGPDNYFTVEPSL